MKNGEAEEALANGGTKVSNRVYRCPKCGFTRYGVIAVELDGRLYYSHQCSERVSHTSYSDDRLEKCLGCEHRQDANCAISGQEIRATVVKATDQCPENKWLAVERFCDKCNKRICDKEGIAVCARCSRVDKNGKLKLPEVDRSYAASPIYVTAADEQFAAGLYMLAWSLLRNNHCRLRVADLGLNRFGNVYKTLQSWGVEFFDPEIGVFPVPGWQLFNKPFILRQALKEAGQVTWIDADIYAGDLSALDDIDVSDPLIPDHKGLVGTTFLYRNKDAFYDSMSLPKVVWRDNASPCTCLIRVNAKNGHDAFLNDWCVATEAAWTTGAIYHASYYDQGIAQDIIDFDMIDGGRWNHINMMSSINRQKKRSYGPSEMVREINKIDGVSIYHFAGKWKPFKEWSSDKMSWGHPLDPNAKVSDSCLVKSPLR